VSNPYAAPNPRDDDGTPPAYGTAPPPPYGTPPSPAAGGTPPPYGTAPGYGQPVPPNPGLVTNSSAVLALVLGIVGVVFAGLLTGIPAIVVGTKARRRIRAGEGTGDGYALAGVVLGWISTVFSVLAILVLILIVVAAVSSTPQGSL